MDVDSGFVQDDISTKLTKDVVSGFVQVCITATGAMDQHIEATPNSCLLLGEMNGFKAIGAKDTDDVYSIFQEQSPVFFFLFYFWVITCE